MVATSERAPRSRRRVDAGEDEPSAATQEVFELLRTRILNGELAPGTEISKLDLTRLLDVGRTPLREAIRLLESEGLIEATGSHRPVTISSLTMQDLDELYSMRVQGEALAIWLSVPMFREAELDELERLAEQTLGGEREVHRAFHCLLRIGAGDRLRDHLERLFEHAQRYQRAYSRSDSAESFQRKLGEHVGIAAACRDRDRDRARALLVDHIASTALALMTAERHAPFMLPLAVEMAKNGTGVRTHH